jgi:hypothetical protein
VVSPTRRVTKSDKEQAEDDVYDRLLRCVDRLPRRTRTSIDAWRIIVLQKRLQDG